MTTGGARLLQRKCACGGAVTSHDGLCNQCRTRLLQRQSSRPGSHAHTAPASVHDVVRSGGRPLDPLVRKFMESRFRHDFGGVRVHSDGEAAASARDVGAIAYTVQDHIVFDAERPAPTPQATLHLLAHELTHVVQQSQAPRAPDGPISTDSEHSPAEHEAERVADAVVTPRAVPRASMSQSAQVSRSVGWAVLGGVIGGVVGGLLGALGGPLGAVIGGLAGAAVGAWLGAALSNDKTDTKGSARQRIHALLTRDAGDLVITDQEAHQALALLFEVEKRDREELFFNYMAMRSNGEWETLKREVPAREQEGVYYFEQTACDPNRGYVMLGDTLKVALTVPGKGHYSDEQFASRTEEIAKLEREEKTLRSAGKWKDAEEARHKRDAMSFEMRSDTWQRNVAGEYNVESDGIHLKDGIPAVPVAGLTLEQAAASIAAAYTDPLLGQLRMSASVTPVKRGVRYAGFGDVTNGETAFASSETSDTLRIMRSEKYDRFSRKVPMSLGEVGGMTEMAVALYYSEIEKDFDKYDDPDVLWKWAREEADKRYTKLNEPTPAQQFLAFGRHMVANKAAMPKPEQARLQETYGRFIGWLTQHENDPKLGSYDPVRIWSQAYLNIVRADVDTEVGKAMAAKKEQRRDEAMKKAEGKFDEVLRFAIKNIWPVQRTRSAVSSEEEISETSGEVMTKSWLITATPAERLMRDKIASDWMSSVLRRMVEDPEKFIATDAKTDFLDYAAQNPEQLEALALLVDNPHVERFEDKVDVPAWQTAIEIGGAFIPLVGNAVAVVEVVAGRDLFNHPLSTTERGIISVGLLLPWAAKGAKLGKGAYEASKLTKLYGLEGAEAARVFRIYTGLAPGSKAAKLFGWGLDELKAGRTIEDPKVLAEMEAALKEIGMADKDTARALMKSADREAGAVATEEVQAVKAMTGPITDETEKMLLDNPGLRQALKENSLAATVLKKCSSPCFPKEATAEHVRRLEGILERIQKTGPINEDALRKFLYERRGTAQSLDKAIADVDRFAGTKSVQKGSASNDLNGFLDFINNPKNVITNLDSVEEVMKRVALAHDVGVAGGRAQAKAEGLVISNFDTPFKQGAFGQGFDDIAIKGSNWDKDLIYIVEHKGGEAALAQGQMSTAWVTQNIQRLYREGGPEGRMWAERLAKALKDGRLRGRAYSTAVEKGGAGATAVLNKGQDWVYSGAVTLVGP